MYTLFEQRLWCLRFGWFVPQHLPHDNTQTPCVCLSVIPICINYIWIFVWFISSARILCDLNAGFNDCLCWPFIHEVCVCVLMNDIVAELCIVHPSRLHAMLSRTHLWRSCELPSCRWPWRWFLSLRDAWAAPRRAFMNGQIPELHANEAGRASCRSTLSRFHVALMPDVKTTRGNSGRVGHPIGRPHLTSVAMPWHVEQFLWHIAVKSVGTSPAAVERRRYEWWETSCLVLFVPHLKLFY